MGASKVYVIQFYREEIGDIGVRDLLIVDTQDVELTAKNALLYQIPEAVTLRGIPKSSIE